MWTNESQTGQAWEDDRQAEEEEEEEEEGCWIEEGAGQKRGRAGGRLWRSKEEDRRQTAADEDWRVGEGA